MPRRRALGALLGAACLGVLALPATPSSAAATGHVVAVRVTGSTARFAVPSTRPGWTHIRNTGGQPFLVLRGTGQGASTLAADYNHHRFSTAARHFPDATTVDPHADAYARLGRGTYFVVAGYHRGTWSAKQIGVLRVSGKTLNSRLPRANTITIDKSYTIHAASTMSRLHYARLVNRSSHAVNVAAVVIDARTSQAAVQKFLAHPSLSKLGTLSSHPRYTLAQASAPRAAIYNPEHLLEGREMLISFRTYSDKLHAGQAKLITVR